MTQRCTRLLVSSLFVSLTAVTFANAAHAEGPPPAAAEPEASSLVVEVRLEEGTTPESDVVLQREDAHGNWEPVCAIPCRAHVRVGARVRVEGAAVLASEPIVLRGEAGKHLELVVTPKSAREKDTRGWLGGGLIGIGLLAGGVGAVSLFTAGLAHLNLSCDPKVTDQECYNDPAHRAADQKEATAKAIGMGFILGGVATAVTGLAVLASAGSVATRTELSGDPPKKAPRWDVGAMPLKRGGGASLSLRF